MSLNDQLHRAVIRNEFESVQFLINSGANVNSVNIETPLVYAAKNNNFEMVRLLVDRGAEVNLPGQFMERPLAYAAQHQNLEMVRFLVQQGANVNVVNNRGFTPLHTAINTVSNIEVVRFLVQQGANVNAVDNEGRTPLEWAFRRGLLEKALFLIDKGAILDTKSLSELEKSSPTFQQTVRRALLRPATNLIKTEPFSPTGMLGRRVIAILQGLTTEQQIDNARTLEDLDVVARSFNIDFEKAVTQLQRKTINLQPLKDFLKTAVARRRGSELSAEPTLEFPISTREQMLKLLPYFSERGLDTIIFENLGPEAARFIRTLPVERKREIVAESILTEFPSKTRSKKIASKRKKVSKKRKVSRKKASKKRKMSRKRVSRRMKQAVR